MKVLRRLLTILLLCLPALAGAAPAAPAATAAAAAGDDTVLAEREGARLTVAEYEAELQKLPKDMRDAFGSDPKRVVGLINNLLVMKSLATDARRAGADQQPLVQRRIALEADRVLADVEVQRIQAAAAADFDARSAEFLQRARELYAVDKKKYATAPQVEVSHILFDTHARGDAAALAAAKDARAKLLAGADFAKLAAAESDDPGSKSKGGRLDWFGQGQMDPIFTRAAFALAKPGDISEPIKTEFGYHIIRLEDKRPSRERSFDEVSRAIMADLRTQQMKRAAEDKMQQVRNDPSTKVNEAAIEKLVTAPARGSPPEK